MAATSDQKPEPGKFVEVVQGELLDQDVDVIVNAWNWNIIPWWLLLPQRVSGPIKRRGGTGPFKELAKHGSIRLGETVLTSAGRLPFKVIIHVAGINMLWRASEWSICRTGSCNGWSPDRPGFAQFPQGITTWTINDSNKPIRAKRRGIPDGHSQRS